MYSMTWGMNAAQQAAWRAQLDAYNQQPDVPGWRWVFRGVGCVE